ncbi:uncharacterized protein LOC129586082 isoform X2 [Paramacrobiotus metropolitanus]|uniref:uncharacterized protein LOC129586082 isoform X2 n=1 Tax=Paramacrobiotus metropolitanus TaxID=2943436 RepID=UPI002445F9A7|nr:uncharacterized protein LOC129586082 isoform X2 [Paramacrobiotus metropolitanus]
MLVGHCVRVLLPSSQIRQRLTAEALQLRTVQPGDFQIRTCRSPVNDWHSRQLLLFPGSNWGDLPRKPPSPHSRLLSNIRGKMFYLQRITDPPLSNRDAASLLRTRSVGFRSNTRRLDSPWAHVSVNLADGPDFCSFPALPELLTETFQSLDTVERQHCRRTCYLWEEILTSDAMSKNVHISLQQPGFGARVVSCRSADYAMYACIFLNITSATRTICLLPPEINRKAETVQTSRGDPPLNLNEGMELEHSLSVGKAMIAVKEALKDTGVRLDQLIIYQRSISVQRYDRSFVGYLDSVAELYSGLAICCNRVIWKDHSLRFESAPLELRIPYASFVLRSVDAPRIWDFFEQRLVCREPLDMELLEYWTNELITRQVKQVESKLAEAVQFGCEEAKQVLSTCLGCFRWKTGLHVLGRPLLRRIKIIY